MSTALIVGGDRIEGIRQVLGSYGVKKISHWTGRKAGHANKIIPDDTRLIVLVTDWVSHSFTDKVKRDASRRGIRIVYTPNGPTALKTRLEKLGDEVLEIDCSSWIPSSAFHAMPNNSSFIKGIIMSVHAINVRNQFRGRIKEIVLGPVVSEVDVETATGIVTSVITTRSVTELNLQVGTEVLALVKATEVSIAKV